MRTNTDDVLEDALDLARRVERGEADGADSPAARELAGMLLQLDRWIVVDDQDIPSRWAVRDVRR